jgi:hypothetical protein
MSVKDTYSQLADIFTRKLMQDLYNGKMNTDEFRRISRGLSALAHYLDFKGVPESCRQ